MPTREGHWCHDLEGSYAPVAELASVDHLGRKWAFNNHGHRTLEWDDHCNRGYCRWILREHGITLTGPAPRSFMPVVPAEVLRREVDASLATLLDDLATWVDIDTLAWGQRYAVVTDCRILYTLETAEVASKAGALEWGMRTLEPRWRPLLAQVRDERGHGWNPHQRPRPGEADDARVRGAHRRPGQWSTPLSGGGRSTRSTRPRRAATSLNSVPRQPHTALRGAAWARLVEWTPTTRAPPAPNGHGQYGQP